MFVAGAGCTDAEKGDTGAAFDVVIGDGSGALGFEIEGGAPKKDPKGLELGGKPPSIEVFFNAELPAETGLAKENAPLPTRHSAQRLLKITGFEPHTIESRSNGFLAATA